MRDLGTANAPLTNDLSVWLWVSGTAYSSSAIYWGDKLFNALYIKTALLYFKRSLPRFLEWESFSDCAFS